MSLPVVGRTMLPFLPDSSLKPEEKALSSSKLTCSQVMEYALPGRKDDSAYKKVCRKIAKLEASRYNDDSKRTMDPVSFLKHIGFEQNLAYPFTSSDIIRIYKILTSHSLTFETSFSTILGLECFSLLTQLEDKEFISAHQTNVWLSNYMKNCIAIFALEGFGKKKCIKTINQEMNDFKIMLNTQPIPDRNPKIKPLLDKWSATQSLLEKFFNHPSAHELLQKSISYSPGIYDTFKLESRQDLNNMFTELSKHMTFINRSLQATKIQHPKVALDELFTSIFRRISKKINEHNLDISSNQKLQNSDFEQIKSHFTRVIEYISDKANIFGKGILQLNDNEPAMAITNDFFTNSLLEVFRVIYFTILGATDPMFDEKVAYENRLLLTLHKLDKYCSKFRESLEVQKEEGSSSSHKAVVVRLIKEICDTFAREVNLLNNEFENLIRSINYCHSQFLIAKPFITQKLKKFSDKLSPLTENVANQLYDLLDDHSDELKQLPLLDHTKMITSAIIAKHDIDMMLYDECDWPCELPLEYLLFLHVQNKAKAQKPNLKPINPNENDNVEKNVDSSPVTQTISSTAKHTADVASDFFETESKDPNPSQTHRKNTPTPKEKTKKSKMFFPRHSQNALRPSKSEKVIDKDRKIFLEKAKQITRRGITWREIEEILKSLNFSWTPGPHTKWFNGRKLMTVTSGHGNQPKQGLTESIYKQLLKNSEAPSPPPSEMKVPKKAKGKKKR